MDILLFLARLFLAGVFLVSGVGKLLDLKGSKEAVRNFGVPAALAPAGGVILPIVELVVAGLLLVEATAWYGAIAALVLNILFIAGIGWNMAKGNQIDCHCFGAIHSAKVGWRPIIRDLVFSAIALFIVLFGTDRFSWGHGNAGLKWSDLGGDMTTWQWIATIVGILMLVAIIAEGWLLYHLLGQNGRLLIRMDEVEAALDEEMEMGGAAGAAPSTGQGLPEGTPAPAFRLEGLYGETMTLDALRSSGKPVMLLFTDPGCGPCNALLPEIGQWQKQYANQLNIAVVSRGDLAANRTKATENGIGQILLQKDREVAEAFKAPATPSAVLIRPDGKIGSGVHPGADSIKQLLARATGAPAMAQQPQQAPPPPAPRPQPTGPAVGADAPDFNLQDLDLKQVKLADFKGQRTLVVFWNPGCGFCRRMVDDIKAWEANTPAGAPKMVLVSTGTADANKELGLKSVTVLDQGFNVGRAFGAGGTPSAIIVDENGKIESELAVGSPGVMELANRVKANGKK